MTALAFYPSKEVVDPVPQQLVEPIAGLQYPLPRTDIEELVGDAVPKYFGPSTPLAFLASSTHAVEMAWHQHQMPPLLPSQACAVTGQMARQLARTMAGSAETVPQVSALAGLEALKMT